MLSQHIECAPGTGGGAGAASWRCLFSGHGAGQPKPLMKKGLNGFISKQTNAEYVKLIV